MSDALCFVLQATGKDSDNPLKRGLDNLRFLMRVFITVCTLVILLWSYQAVDYLFLLPPLTDPLPYSPFSAVPYFGVSLHMLICGLGKSIHSSSLHVILSAA